MAFETYRPRLTNDSKISITKHHIRLGGKLANQLKSDQIEVAYDKESNQLRLRGVKDGGIKVNKNKIGAKSIFKYFGIEDIKGSFIAKYDEQDNAVYVDLNK